MNKRTIPPDYNYNANFNKRPRFPMKQAIPFGGQAFVNDMSSSFSGSNVFYRPPAEYSNKFLPYNAFPLPNLQYEDESFLTTALPPAQYYENNYQQDIGKENASFKSNQGTSVSYRLPTERASDQETVDSKFKALRAESLRVFNGNVEKTILWSKMVRTQNVLFEVIGKLESMREGKYAAEKLLLLRDANPGPVLQVVYYDIDRPLPQFETGSFVRVIGSMRNRSRLQAYAVLPSSIEELQALQHVVFICDRAAQELAKVKNSR